jgi:hypothetical protein
MLSHPAPPHQKIPLPFFDLLPKITTHPLTHNREVCLFCTYSQLRGDFPQPTGQQKKLVGKRNSFASECRQRVLGSVFFKQCRVVWS